MASLLGRANFLGPAVRGTLNTGHMSVKCVILPLRRFLNRSAINYAAGIPLKMPSLSPTMSEGTIVKWMKQEGDEIQPGDIICDIQTDKAVVSFEVEEEGILAKILKPEDSKDVPVGELIALMVEPGEDWKSVEVPTDVTADPSASRPAAAPGTQEALPGATAEFSGLRHTGTIPTTVGPAVRSLLQQYGVDASKVTPSGPHSNLLKGDVLNYIQQHSLKPLAPEPVPAPSVSAAVSKAPAAAPSPPVAAPAPVAPDQPAPYIDIELTSMRKTIAKRLTQSKTEIPHAYVQSQARIDRLLAVRKALKAEGVDASLNDYIVKAVALSLRLHPNVNCVWNGDTLVPSASVDVSIAVATDAGLITPIVRRAAEKSVSEISSDVRDLATRARAGKLKLDEFQGGSFTISNLGMFGIGEFSAIINPPQCGILAVGGGRPQLAPDGGAETLMTSTLSYDASAISEPEAAAFMETLATLLDSPDLIVADARRALRQIV